MAKNPYRFIVNETESLRDVIQGGNRGCMTFRNGLCCKDAGCPEYKHYGRLASWWAANRERRDTVKIWNYRK